MPVVLTPKRAKNKYNKEDKASLCCKSQHFDTSINSAALLFREPAKFECSYFGRENAESDSQPQLHYYGVALVSQIGMKHESEDTEYFATVKVRRKKSQ